MSSRSTTWKRLSLAVVLAAAMSLLSCSAGLITPKKGVTEQFFKEDDGKFVDLADYDFSRLERGYGLCVFSFDYLGMKGNSITGFKSQTERGLRVWEYKFKADDWEIKKLRKKMLVWGSRDPLALYLTKSGYVVSIFLEFHRGRIVYAGRLKVEWPLYLIDGPETEFRFDEDMQPWLNLYGDRVKDIKIDSVQMTAAF